MPLEDGDPEGQVAFEALDGARQHELRFDVEKFHGALKSQGIAIARDTLHRLLSHLEDCFLVRVVWMESNSERQRMVNPRKAYPVDPGLIPVFDRTGRANTGHALETAVLVELERRGFEVTYLRTPEGYEVDFLARARAAAWSWSRCARISPIRRPPLGSFAHSPPGAFCFLAPASGC